ncbi:response regulator transcription factor [Aristaeella hokkaidonensis]|uniref:Response regulator n=1 Tax=Aristaeella hokkaidonensis TaxID=3046382 RepID=A0AC61MUF6_9FIRM|nr:response regulator [Aristaeella hokkaidonensis]MBQ6288459.1 response regulator [Clostridia bacterium]QTE70560.1 response regulator [Clostridiales bacterium FE2011]QTE74527.1 response regulator [Clostridiales bacterium FE2010]QUC65862.1 response regulator [Aristaeella hokkaidonensis]SNT93925.1 Helix-turn-helix domain-containing protein [Aristaeella hokkaidonensis]
MYRVVLVDDERLIIRGLSTVIPWAELGCEIAGTAHDGVSGLELIRSIRPDIVLTDIRMPNMDGLTMLAAIRSEFPGIQMSVLTAYRDFEYARKAITLGVCRYLLKPSNLDELQEAVKLMVSRLDAMPQLPEDPDDESVKEAGNHLVKAALAYMKEHCTEQHLSLGEVADHVYVSQWHLSKLLNRETDQSFFDLLGSMRIAKAKKLLADPALRIHEIAEMAGFSDVAHFSRSFKKIAGCTPGEYRNHQM